VCSIPILPMTQVASAVVCHTVQFAPVVREQLCTIERISRQTTTCVSTCKRMMKLSSVFLHTVHVKTSHSTR
jgi:hypothetical protein